MCWTCNFCSKSLELKSKFTKSGHLAKCTSFTEYKQNILTKEYLTQMYVEKGYSAIELAHMHNLESATAIINLLKLFGIHRRTSSEAKLQLRAKSKTENTLLQKYGVSHNLQAESPIRKEMIIRLQNFEGVTNVFQRPDVIKDIKEKSYITKVAKSLCTTKEDKSDFQNYRRKIDVVTRNSYKEHITVINPDNLIRSKTGFHLDHMFSVFDGFIQSVPIYIIAHPANLTMLNASENTSKNLKSSITLEELLKRIDIYDTSNYYTNTKT